MNSAEPTMVKIKSVEVKRLSGMRGFTIVLPWSWVSDVNLSPGDYVDIYRDVKDRLILIQRKVVDGMVSKKLKRLTE